MAADSKDPKEAVFLYQQAEFWYKMAGDQGHAQQARRNLERLQGISRGPAHTTVAKPENNNA